MISPPRRWAGLACVNRISGGITSARTTIGVGPAGGCFVVPPSLSMNKSNRPQGIVSVGHPDIGEQFTTLNVGQKDRVQPKDYRSSDSIASQRQPNNTGSPAQNTMYHIPASLLTQSTTRLPALPSNPAQGRPRIQPVVIPSMQASPAPLQAQLRPQQGSYGQLPRTPPPPGSRSPKPLRGILKSATPLQRPTQPQRPQAPGVAGDNLWGVSAAAASPISPGGSKKLKGVMRFLRGSSSKSALLEGQGSSPLKSAELGRGFSDTNNISPPVPLLPRQMPPPPLPPNPPRSAVYKLRFSDGVEVIPRPDVDSDPYEDDELEGLALPPSPRRNSVILDQIKTGDFQVSPATSPSNSQMDSPASYLQDYLDYQDTIPSPQTAGTRKPH